MHYKRNGWDRYTILGVVSFKASLRIIHAHKATERFQGDLFILSLRKAVLSQRNLASAGKGKFTVLKNDEIIVGSIWVNVCEMPTKIALDNPSTSRMKNARTFTGVKKYSRQKLSRGIKDTGYIQYETCTPLQFFGINKSYTINAYTCEHQRFGVCTAVMKIALLWDVMPRSLVASYNRF
jgi:hypothetical protein